MCAYFCIGFIDFTLARKDLTDFTNIFQAIYLKKKGDLILNYFMINT